MEAMMDIAAEFEHIWKLDSLDQSDYDRLHRHVSRIPSIGELGVNHVIGIAAIVGLLPLTMFRMMKGGAKKFVQLLEKRFKEQLPSKADILENIKFMAEVVLKKKLSERNGENIACKIGWICLDSDGHYCDVWEVGFFSFELDDKAKKIMLDNGTELESSFMKREGGRWVANVEFEAVGIRKQKWMWQYM